MPAPQTEQENCVAHNGSLIPVPGRDIMVQAWYQGGVSVFDFTDAAKPVEIAFFDRGPIDAKAPALGRVLVGVLVQRPHLRLRDRARHRRVQAEAERVPVAERDRRREAGPDRGAQYAAADEDHLAGQLGGGAAPTSISSRAPRAFSRTARRSREEPRSIAPTSMRTGRERGAAAVLDQLDALATQLESDAGAASGTRRGAPAVARGDDQSARGEAANLEFAGALYRVDRLDPTTFLGVAAVLLAVAILASYLPARRATRVDPIRALRSE